MKDLYEGWAERLRALHGAEVAQRRRIALDEVERLQSGVADRGRDPAVLQQQVDVLEAEVARLCCEIQELQVSLEKQAELKQQSLAEKLRQTLAECREIVKRHNLASHQEFVSQATKVLREQGNECDLLHDSPRAVRNQLRPLGSRRDEIRTRMEASLATANEQAGSELSWQRQRRDAQARLEGINEAIQAGERALQEGEHGVDRRVLAALAELRADAEFLAFCRERISDAQLEHRWGWRPRMQGAPIAVR